MSEGVVERVCWRGERGCVGRGAEEVCVRGCVAKRVCYDYDMILTSDTLLSTGIFIVTRQCHATIEINIFIGLFWYFEMYMCV